MRRRDLITRLLAASGAAWRPALFSGFGAAEVSPEVKRVLVMFKCHLDVGFTDTQAAVVRKYIDEYFPRAIQVAAEVQRSGPDRYIWTTGSWIFRECLKQSAVAQRRAMEEAVFSGNLSWHALPFTWETELLDRSMIEGALGFSEALDRYFGRTTIAAKMTDVPGHSRGLVGPLAAHGVKFLDIGVNEASTPPEVPPLFVWREPKGASVMVMYHHQYGGIVQVPGSDLAVAVEMRGDNLGPHTPEEVAGVYAGLRQRFPNARVTAASLSEIAAAVTPHGAGLPVVTQEIGDTWIHGVPSDPAKVARFREMARLRREWLAQQRFRTGDSTDGALLARLALCAEHTWGVDTGELKDYRHYTPVDLAAALDRPAFSVMATSWAEKRRNIDDALATLPAALQREASQRLRALAPREPGRFGLRPHAAGRKMENAHWVLALDAQTGAIAKLRAKAKGREWASALRPLALFAYQTISKADYDRFFANYLVVKARWAERGMGKPNIEDFGAQSRVWRSTLAGCWSGRAEGGHRLLAQLRIEDPAAERSGTATWPARIYLDVFLPDAEPEVRIELLCFDKVANRLPEALWLSFIPEATYPEGWSLEKVGQWVSPFDVVRGGNRHMHAVSRVLYRDGQGTLGIEPLDAPVVALGEMQPIYYSPAQPDLAKGLHFCLFNNVWGTNYVQWYHDDMRFRFVLRG